MAHELPTENLDAMDEIVDQAIVQAHRRGKITATRFVDGFKMGPSFGLHENSIGRQNFPVRFTYEIPPEKFDVDFKITEGAFDTKIEIILLGNTKKVRAETFRVPNDRANFYDVKHGDDFKIDFGEDVLKDPWLLVHVNGEFGPSTTFESESAKPQKL